MYKTKELIKSKIRKIFPESSIDEIFLILANYGTENYEKEKDRVYLAILKLCEEENLNDPSIYVQAAKRDYRDVIAWAEYPNQMKTKSTAILNSEEFVKLKKLDEEQYLQWINSE